ncbi:hypothetical protein Forpe1208_v010009 [Fusarium oxysporum f. sp. rapae]|uniref:Zn(2)-C6 fungal-type domain-containing protein n=1 Tax=Fusarium oxysporum f. sp. rapae TaxID=485398 RepID=A0A8J5TRC0_FUSOX|nr:hypothetical protein Forpe1208_v010009 [Fusarium oxysporum f. sp. rapae]
MGKFQGRKLVACTACHSQKLKCSGDIPCHRCIQRNRECVYPKKDKFITVPESYLRDIEEKASINSQFSFSAGTEDSTALFHTSRFSPTIDTSPLKELCPAEVFIQKLTDISALLHPYIQTESCQQLQVGEAGEFVPFRLKIRDGGTEMLVKLPSEKQAMHLLRTFEDANSEYHWFLRQRFRDRIRQTHSQPTSHVNDRNWFCQLSLVLALGQALEKEPKRESEETNDPWDFNQSSAPLDLFGQAVSLYSLSETLTLENLETSNLMAYYCHCTNRPKTAVVYISQSIALARLLQLDDPKTYKPDIPERRDSKSQRITIEHMLRLWWTTVGLDKTLASELEMTPVYSSPSLELPLPSSHGLSPEDEEEFFDLELLLAEIQS